MNSPTRFSRLKQMLALPQLADWEDHLVRRVFLARLHQRDASHFGTSTAYPTLSELTEKPNG